MLILTNYCLLYKVNLLTENTILAFSFNNDNYYSCTN